MKFTIIGHFCFDITHHPNGTETKEYAGIFRTITTLSKFATSTDTIYPIFGVNKKDKEEVKQKLSSYKNVDTSGIFSSTEETNQIHIFFNEEKKIECSKHIASPIPFSAIKPYLATDGVLINMSSGVDIALETLDEIRLAVREKNIPIHLDIHNLTLGINSDATRFRRPVSDWRRWCFMVDSVQMNEEEAAGLTVEKYDEETLAKQMLPLMVKALCITRGGKGATLFSQERKTLVRKDFSGKNTDENIIGAGDIFGATFFYHYCMKKNFEEAIQCAMKNFQ